MNLKDMFCPQWLHAMDLRRASVFAMVGEA